MIDYSKIQASIVIKQGERKIGLDERICPLYLSGCEYKNNSTEIFAYYGKPKKIIGKVKTIMLVHGGDGRSYENWVKNWVEKGYIALALDFNRHCYTKECGDFSENKDGGPKGYGSIGEDLKNLDNSWVFVSIKNLIKATKFLINDKQVDKNKLYIHGISWGGYLVYILLGTIDLYNRGAVSYTTAYLYKDEYWKNKGLTKENMGQNYEKWINMLDPKNYIKNINTELILVRGENDVCFSKDLIQPTISLFRKRKIYLKLFKQLGHSQELGEQIDIVQKFIEKGIIDDSKG